MRIFAIPNLLLSKELRIIKLSSRYVIISDVSAPFNSNSPLDLKLEKERILPVQSLTTCASLASISFSLTAEMHTSYNSKQMYLPNSFRIFNIAIHINSISNFHHYQKSLSSINQNSFQFTILY